MKGNLNLESGTWGLNWQFKVEQNNGTNRLIFEMLYPSKVSSYYSLTFSDISTPTTYKQMFLQNFKISTGENIILVDSEIKFLSIIDCSDVKIVNSIMQKSLVLLKSTNVEIENCHINTIHVPDTNHNIKVKNSIIKKATEGSAANYNHVE
jgi:hypothetical protein